MVSVLDMGFVEMCLGCMESLHFWLYPLFPACGTHGHSYSYAFLLYFSGFVVLFSTRLWFPSVSTPWVVGMLKDPRPFKRSSYPKFLSYTCLLPEISAMFSCLSSGNTVMVKLFLLHLYSSSDKPHCKCCTQPWCSVSEAEIRGTPCLIVSQQNWSREPHSSSLLLASWNSSQNRKEK